MDVLCIDDRFPPAVLEGYRAHGITPPTAQVVYTIRAVKRHSNGEVGLLLNELHNPTFPQPFAGMTLDLEPSWNVRRFATLTGEPLQVEELQHVTS